MPQAVDQKVEEIITNNPVVVFSKSYCPHCTNAIKTLESVGHPPTVIQLDLVEDGPAQHEYLKEKTAQRTVPVIFLKGKFIGGNSKLQELHNDNKLQALL